jgi:uncharacterized protein YbaR (Trm112 family)
MSDDHPPSSPAPTPDEAAQVGSPSSGPSAVEAARIDSPPSAPAAVEATRIDPKLLELLVCPLTKGPLDYDAEAQELISRQAKLAYPIRDGIPIMLPEEARVLTE